MSERKQQLIAVRGGGDLATGTIHKLVRCGWPVVILETDLPSAIRRQVSFCEAVYNGTSEIEGIVCRRAMNVAEVYEILKNGEVPLLVDPKAASLKELKPWAVVDAILAKKNLGTTRDMAKKTIALGPGFEAGVDVDLVIETKRGHNLARIITSGTAAPNTGIPGVIAGFGKERVIHSPARGIFLGKAKIGDVVEKDQVIGVVVTGAGEVEVPASLTGILRGLIRDGYPVSVGFKIADIDPRESELDNCFTISDKARAIAGSVVEALLWLEAKEEEA